MDAVSLLDPAKIIGTVFNGDNGTLEPYGGYYNYYNRNAAGEPQHNPRGSNWWRRTVRRTS
jgi:hypothetical protein